MRDGKYKKKIEENKFEKNFQFEFRLLYKISIILKKKKIYKNET